jgi:hypothetical protein
MQIGPAHRRVGLPPAWRRDVGEQIAECDAVVPPH